MELDWAENLPEDCPPADAETPETNEIFFRVVYHDPPEEFDFQSHRILFGPDHPFRNRTECETRACSLSSEIDYLRSLRLRNLKRRQVGRFTIENAWIAEVRLLEDSGVIRFDLPGPHVSWWRTKNFDPESQCKLIPNNG